MLVCFEGGKLRMKLNNEISRSLFFEWGKSTRSGDR